MQKEEEVKTKIPVAWIEDLMEVYGELMKRKVVRVYGFSWFLCVLCEKRR